MSADGTDEIILPLAGRTLCAADLAARSLKPAAVLAADRPHGERLKYIGGCRCDLCRAANSRYESERQRARKAGDWNGIIDAAPARAHMLKLRRKGVGRRAVAAASDVADSVVHAIATGQKTRIRARTARRILAVTTAMASDRALTSAGATWQRIEQLLDEGFTKGQIAQKLGSKLPALQIGKQRLTVRKAHQVECLHRRLLA